MARCIIIILWLYLAGFSVVVPRPVVKQHHLIRQMMLFNLSSASPSRVITCSAPACHQPDVINNNYKSTNMINTYWNSSAQAGNDFLPKSQRFPDVLAEWEMLIHHRRLSWYLLIKVSARLTGTPVLVIDVLYDVSHFSQAGIDCLLSGGFWLRWICVVCNSEARTVGWCCPWGLTGGTASPVPNPEMCEELQNLSSTEARALCEAAEAALAPAECKHNDRGSVCI